MFDFFRKKSFLSFGLTDSLLTSYQLTRRYQVSNILTNQQTITSDDSAI